MKQKQAQLVAALDLVKENCALRAVFLERFGTVLLSDSRGIYEVATFLKSIRESGIEVDTSSTIEEDLLDSATALCENSRDIVTFSQLERGLAYVVEQKIDPVELVRFGVSTVRKKYPNVSVSFDEDVARGLIVSGDQEKLKQLLVKLIGFSMQYVQTNGAGVAVNLMYKKVSGLMVMVKVVGSYLSEQDFHQFCFPLEKPRQGDRIDLDLAIARQLAQLHGGDVMIHDQSASGTVLSFCLPDA